MFFLVVCGVWSVENGQMALNIQLSATHKKANIWQIPELYLKNPFAFLIL